VTLGLRLGGEVLIYSGVRAGDRVIVDGLFKARPGSEVKPVPLQEGAARGLAPEAPKEGVKPAGPKK
jgi:membrane fusion protein (multidrug efflux system)